MFDSPSGVRHQSGLNTSVFLRFSAGKDALVRWGIELVSLNRLRLKPLVSDSLLNSLVIEIGYLFAEMEKRRRSRSQCILIVCNYDP
jgi:hypothetical protein